MNSSQRDDLVFGRHPAESILKSEQNTIDRIWLQQDIQFPNSFNSLLFSAKRRGIKLNYVDRKTLDRLTEGAVHQGVVIRIAACRTIDYYSLIESIESMNDAIILVLDHVQDPRNLGAIFRSAAAAQISGIIFPKHGSAPLSGTAMKASAGTLTAIPAIQVGNLADTLRDLKKREYWVVGISHDGVTNLASSAFPRRLVCVFGGEDTGLRPVIRKECDEIRSIPMHGPAGSLNVSVAVGIVLYECVRSRLTPSR